MLYLSPIISADLLGAGELPLIQSLLFISVSDDNSYPVWNGRDGFIHVPDYKP